MKIIAGRYVGQLFIYGFLFNFYLFIKTNPMKELHQRFADDREVNITRLPA